eukprot:CAMPEP_0176297552 /NCGR_PEP_ID=MMETSP0121_2-20121125/58780_1 /TAXON_ID=160619 /ORGANISM="Kryptoperidinium foliaceum, Strain CCMP 1326" /LENGTH=46 /DNA_ID= /DNA_START= /DNA_END= /DNA_ORIENTATION=
MAPATFRAASGLSGQRAEDSNSTTVSCNVRWMPSAALGALRSASSM